MNTNEADPHRLEALPKSPTGIEGLDEIVNGGLPKGRPTLVCGSAGSGKTILSMEFLIRGARDMDEPGVFFAFEETPEELAQNVASLGFEVPALVAAKKLCVEHIFVERSEIEETGEFDLEGLFIRIGYAIDSIKAKRVVLDTLEVLFGGLPNPAIVRAELRRLFRWLKEKGVTAIITGERGDGILTRYGIEEYVSDCVIVLDHRVTDQLTTRRLRVLKYRGSLHGTNEYPFLIDRRGITVLPITSVAMEYKASEERISSGIPKLDAMLGGRGYYRGTTILMSGTAGCGKTSVASHFAQATCQRGERCLHFLFEESSDQLMRNMRSIGIDLRPYLANSTLRFHVARPTQYGIEMHLTTMLQEIKDFRPSVVIADPISCFDSPGNGWESKAMLTRLVDFLKLNGITALLINLTTGGAVLEKTESEMSSLVDTWLLLRDIESNGERNRAMYVLKSRGMAHSNQVREFHLTSQGVELRDVYLGPSGVLTGSARLAQEARERAELMMTQQEMEGKRLLLERKRQAVESQIAALRAEFAAEEVQTLRQLKQDEFREQTLLADREEMACSRKVDFRNCSSE